MPNTAAEAFTASQRRDLENLGERLARFGVNFAVMTTHGALVAQVNGGRFESD